MIVDGIDDGGEDEMKGPKGGYDNFMVSGIGQPSVNHAVVVIFLEFFSWGLLTTPTITVLKETFPDHTFLMNGLIVGIKGLLSFLCAPLIGALSDSLGRKFFLLITVAFTCAPIPLMIINTWWYFAMISLSGMFAVTFSVVFAYVADVTSEEERSTAYGLVSATFAASLVTSPALGAYLARQHSDSLVVLLATLIALLDVLFILFCVPESMPELVRAKISWAASLSWEKADPFKSLRHVGKDQMILLLCTAVLLSYLPEAGQYSCFFVYLRLVIGFSAEEVALFIAVVGLLSVVAQTLVLTVMMKAVGDKRTIMIGLLFEMLQLLWYGFGSERWMIWSAGGLASICSITYPAISAFVSTHAEPNKQGLAQGMITGMRSLCTGLGPAVFGFIFYLFHVNLNDETAAPSGLSPLAPSNNVNESDSVTQLPSVLRATGPIPGPPFVFGAMMVSAALVVATFIPEGRRRGSSLRSPTHDVAGPSQQRRRRAGRPSIGDNNRGVTSCGSSSSGSSSGVGSGGGLDSGPPPRCPPHTPPRHRSSNRAHQQLQAPSNPKRCGYVLIPTEPDIDSYASYKRTASSGSQRRPSDSLDSDAGSGLASITAANDAGTDSVDVGVKAHHRRQTSRGRSSSVECREDLAKPVCEVGFPLMADTDPL